MALMLFPLGQWDEYYEGYTGIYIPAIEMFKYDFQVC